MPIETNSPIPAKVEQFCRQAGLGAIQSIAKLTGGIQSTVQRLFTSSGATVILKEHPHAPSDWYALEAEGLRALKLPGCPRVPEVYLVGRAFLLLEDVTDSSGAVIEPPARYWESFGRQLATLHRHHGSSHGYSHNNYLGLMPQTNGQMSDGRAFYVEHRVRRYLREPLCHATLAKSDFDGVEKLCERILKEFPDLPPSLCHGDLWTGNMLIGRSGEPVYIDPAIHFGPAEAELSLTRQFGGVPDAFYDAYREINPLEPGWPDRLRVYELKEMLALIAQFGDEHQMLAPLRDLIRDFA